MSVESENTTAKSNAQRSLSDSDSKYQQSFLARVERNQIFISRSLLLGLYLVHNFIPMVLPYTSKFIHLQYKIGTDFNGNPLYDIGIHDAYYVLYWVIMLTFLRSFLMQSIFGPFAMHACNIRSRKAKVRFAEQSWSFVYYTFSFIFGVYLYCKSDYFLNFDRIYIGWPHFEMSALFKMYYLISMAFWIQQIFVLNVENKRKDHYQMFSHHIITCLLIVGSYYYYYNRIGHLILMIMDSVDIFLAAAKMLNYANYRRLCDSMFVLFLVSWIVLRHGLYNYLLYHTWSKSEILMGDMKCVPGKVQKRCWTQAIINSFLFLLGGLQVITLVWMYLILKVAYKVVTGKGAEDVRSDDDDTDIEDSKDDK
ncbi:uncharacterized protein PRCAT00005225001 [Priceomyces carsonii]|uniref:uncharacterized protein n=1 Tax=Priceomyces carsonii TaxID=28549 RepID=UPI002ED97496|nr:unnamed protein product [Priceomyces carsonii]